jgi:hypothetical protein
MRKITFIAVGQWVSWKSKVGRAVFETRRKTENCVLVPHSGKTRKIALIALGQRVLLEMYGGSGCDRNIQEK